MNVSGGIIGGKVEVGGQADRPAMCTMPISYWLTGDVAGAKGDF